MSWKQYTDNIKTACNNKLVAVGIFGVAGGLWHAEGINLTNEECAKLANAIENQDKSIFGTGFTLNDQKFAVTKLDDDVICGKGKEAANCWGKGEAVIFKTVQAIFVAVGGLGDSEIKATSMLNHFYTVCEPLKDSGY